MTIVDAFIDWAVRRARYATPVVTFEGAHLFERYAFMRRDEWSDGWWEREKAKYPKRPNALPWWCPVNAFLHQWNTAEGVAESFHDHPRWSVTVCLKGEIVERTPWGDKTLRPGHVVIRSRKAIHAFRTAEGYAGEVWTLFIVGRRKHRQNTFVVTPR